MSHLAPPTKADLLSSDDETLDEVNMDAFSESHLQLAASPIPPAASLSLATVVPSISPTVTTPVQADRAVSEEAVHIPRVSMRGTNPNTIYQPDGGGITPPLRTARSEETLPGSRDESSTTSFFSTRTGVFDAAVSKCKQVLKPSDGKLHSAWLLTQIDHWDVEKERLVLLTERSLLVIKYDFIALQAGEVTRVRLNTPDRVQIGELTYPPSSITPRISGIAGGLVSVVRGCLFGGVSQTMSQLRQCVPRGYSASTSSLSTARGISFQPRYRLTPGVRISWDCGRPLSLKQNWNPLARDIPFITFTSHALFWNKAPGEDAEWERYSVEAFSRPLLELVSREQERPDTPSHCVVERGPILISNYVGVLSLLHNSTELGFFKNRGRVSF